MKHTYPAKVTDTRRTKSRRKYMHTNMHRSQGDGNPTFQGFLFGIVPVSLRLIFRLDSTKSYFCDSLVATGTRRVRPRCDTNLYRPVPNLNLVQIQIEKLHPEGNKQLFQKPMYTPRHLSKIYVTIYKFTRRHSDISTYTSESERGCPIYYCDLTFLGRTDWI